MTRRGQSFLDLCALPRVGALILDPRPALLWADDGFRVLWANAAGAEQLGEAAIHALIERRFPPADPIGVQVAAIAPAIRPGEPQLAVLRLGSGPTPDPHLCLCSRLPIDDETDGILIASMQPPLRVEPLPGRAAGLARAAAEEDVIVAVTRPDGRRVASSDGFDGLPDGERSLGEFTASAAISGRRLLKRRLRFGDERRLVGMAAATTPEGEFILALIGPAEASEGRLLVGASVEASRSELISAPAAPPPSLDPMRAHPPATVEGGVIGGDRDPVPRALPPAPAAAPPVLRVPAGAAGRSFEFHPRPAPVRFAFNLDEAHRFSRVSPELAAVVGPRPADVVGRSWAEVARDYGFEATEAVERALERRDTWSGVTVYWPIQDSPDTVAVDLAALPAFAKGGGFDGFRGFGVCRTGDVRRGVSAEAVAVAALPADAGPGAAEPASTFPLLPRSAGLSAPGPDLGTTQLGSEGAAAEEPPASNIVRLRSLPSPTQRRDLSGNEQDAFRRIAEALKTASPRKAPAAPTRTAASSNENAGAATEDPRESAATGLVPVAPITIAAPRPEDAIPARLLDRLPLGVVVFRDRKVLFANRAFLDRLGYADAASLEAQGGIAALFPGQAETTAAGEDDRRRIKLRAGDGSEIAVEAKLHVAPWTDGPATMLSVRTEAMEAAVGRQHLADQQAALSRIDELEAVLDTATDGVVVLDADARIMSLNRSAEALFGVEATDVLGKPFADLLAEESRRSALDYLEGLTKNGVASVLNDGREVIGRTPLGGLIPLFMTMGRLAERGKFCAVLRDITQWKHAEEELVAARRAAEIANHHKSEFLAKISHEIRTPLNAVIGFSEVMLEERFGPIGNERYREYLRDIKLSGLHLMSLINDLLDLSKIEAGKLDLDFAAVPVNDIIQEGVALMQPEANRRRIIIRTSLAAAVPRVVADPRSLRQIVLNLLSNAVKFTLAGGQVIVSTALDDNGEVVIRIRDTGIGMTDKELETALKPFRQIATANRGVREGTGLGLPLTKALVEANRATFAIDSTPNQGTMARVTFPITRVLPG